MSRTDERGRSDMRKYGRTRADKFAPKTSEKKDKDLENVQIRTYRVMRNNKPNQEYMHSKLALIVGEETSL